MHSRHKGQAFLFEDTPMPTNLATHSISSHSTQDGPDGPIRVAETPSSPLEPLASLLVAATPSEAWMAQGTIPRFRADALDTLPRDKVGAGRFRYPHLHRPVGSNHHNSRATRLPAMQEVAEKIDIYRDTPLRYAGYLNEVGEAFRPLVPVEAVILSYVGAITYVMADGFSKGGETASLPQNKGVSGCGAAALADTLVFQFLASVIFPSTVINRGVALTIFCEEQFAILDKIESAFSAPADQVLFSPAGVDITPSSVVSTLPTAIGLALIPLIVEPIDGLVEYIQDEYLRPFLEKTFPQCFLPFCTREECEMPD